MKLNFIKHGTMTKESSEWFDTSFSLLGAFALFIYYLIYVLSNASITFEPSDSLLKHIFVIIIAIISIITNPGRSIKCLAVFSPLVVVYYFGELKLYALMVSIFALSLPLFADGLQSYLTPKGEYFIGFLFLIAIFPIINALINGNTEAIYNSYYGRDRLLLGYWHPKEAAASLSLPFLFLILKAKSLKSWLTLTPILFWLIGSRNVALAMLLLMVIRHRPTIFRHLIYLIPLILLSIIILEINFFDLLDKLISLRISFWEESLTGGLSKVLADLSESGRFTVDSFYVEILIASGITGLMIIFIWIITIYYVILHNSSKSNRWSLAAFFSILFFAAFDSGIASTGNIFHLLLWALASIGFHRNWSVFKKGSSLFHVGDGI